MADLYATLEATDIALTNMLQTCSDRALPDPARAKLRIIRDRIRTALASDEPDPRHATREDLDDTDPDGAL